MPEGFDIDPDPTVQVSKKWKNCSKCFLLYYGGRGRLQGKIYNAGYAGDTVRVTVTWKLTNLLFLYKDIAELNWQPLTDSTGDIKRLSLKLALIPQQRNSIFMQVNSKGL